MATDRTAAIGFRDHSGWCVAVALGGDPDSPEVLWRGRLEIVDSALPRQPYHAVAEQGAPREVIVRVEASALASARTEIGRMRGEVAAKGFAVRIAAVAIGRSQIPADVEKILGAHTLLHAAEGELYRRALAEAAAADDLRVLRFAQKEVFGLAGPALGLEAGAVRELMDQLGKPLGPPWRMDHKEAAAAAWWALRTGASR